MKKKPRDLIDRNFQIFVLSYAMEGKYLILMLKLIPGIEICGRICVYQCQGNIHHLFPSKRLDQQGPT